MPQQSHDYKGHTIVVDEGSGAKAAETLQVDDHDITVIHNDDGTYSAEEHYYIQAPSLLALGRAVVDKEPEDG